MFLTKSRWFAACAIAIEIEGDDGVTVGIGHVKQLAIGRKRDAVGARLPLRHHFDDRLRRDVPDAVEIEFAVIVRAAEGRIGEIDVPVSANHNIVRRIEFLSLIILRRASRFRRSDRGA